MIDRVIAVSVRYRWIVVLCALVLAVWGIRAALRTPIDAIPDLSENQVIVFTNWSGHGPREIEDQVTYPLTLELKGLAGVRVVRSSSDVGFSTISVIFNDDVGWEAARREVAEVLARSAERWPEGVTPRLAPDGAATGQIFWYTIEGGKLDPGRLRAIQDWYVRPQLAAVQGVAEVASVGGFPLEYQVELDPHRLQAHGLTAAQVAEAVRRANAPAGGNVLHKGNAEYVARGAGWLGSRPGQAESPPDPQRVIRDLENVNLTSSTGVPVSLADVAHVSLGGAPRRGVLDKDGEATGGVVLMRHGENPLEVTRRLRARIQELAPGLPPGVRIVTVYDRTPLIQGTIGTVTDTLLEAILTATICIVIVLRHLRTAFVVAVTLPLAVLFSFGLVDVLRQTGLLTVETNLMSLAGLAISVGVMVDSSIVMTENVMHRLKRRWGEEPVRGDTRAEVEAACRQVGRPMFFAVGIMLLSFLPVFALGGLEGKMFHPLAYTKSFAMVGVALLSITLVPSLCTILVRGRLRSEEDVALMRGLRGAYRPVLAFLLDHAGAITWFVGLTFILGAAVLGKPGLLGAVVAAAVVLTLAVTSGGLLRWLAVASLVLVGLLAGQWLTPLKKEFATPLDEGMVMDMPITVPRMSVTQAADDLRARDMVLCRFPEVEMVVGKAGRAETATDPAPLDMIETMIAFRPREFWPRRCLKPADAERQARAVLDALIEREQIQAPADRSEFANHVAMDAVALFDAQIREAAYQRNKEFEGDLGQQQGRFMVAKLIERLNRADALTDSASAAGLPALVDSVIAGHTTHLAMDPTPEAVAALLHDAVQKLNGLGAIKTGSDLERSGFFGRGIESLRSLLGMSRPTLVDDLVEEARAFHRDRWREHVNRLNTELRERAGGLYTRLVLEAILHDAKGLNPRVAVAVREWERIRSGSAEAPAAHHGGAGGHHAGHAGHGGLPFLEPVPELDAVQTDLTRSFSRNLLLWPRDRVELAGFGGELDRAVQMPGWTNVWTMPIQNRVDMLTTGVNTTIGVRVLGRRIEDVVRVSEEIAAALKNVSGAADVIADPVRGKGYLEVTPDREKAKQLGVDPGAIADLVEVSLGGRVVTTTVEGRERYPVRVRYGRDFRQDEETVRDLAVLARTPAGRPTHVPLSAVADVRITEGPASIRGENGLMRNYVRLNVRGRDVAEFVPAAQQAVAAQVRLPEGVSVEWTGQFEHELQAQRTLTVTVPLVLLIIFLLLCWTFRDLADAGLLFLAVPGALAGGLILQRLLGYPLSVAAWVGYIACFGMATSTGVVMIVYLRQAVADAGGLQAVTLVQLRTVVLNGAAHRLRPKLLTEATTLLGLAPLLLATGPGAEVLRPMVVPVLGGLLIADEVIDLFLPVLFYRVRLRRWRLLHAASGTPPGSSRGAEEAPVISANP